MDDVNPPDEPTPEQVIYSLVIAPALSKKSKALWFAARSTGLYVSGGEGAEWSFAYQELTKGELLATTAVALSPDYRHDRTVFAGVPGAVLKSTDGGQQWKVSYLPPPAPMVTCLSVSPNYAQDNTLFIGTGEDGVFHSTDGGASWARWNFGLLDLSILCLAVSPGHAEDETLYVGTGSGLFRSTNGGRAWREVQLPPEFDAVLSLALSPAYPQDGILFAGTEANGLFASHSRGETWTRLGEDKIDDPINAILLAPDFPATPEMAVLSGVLTLFSHDSGKRWSRWRPGDIPKDFEVAALAAPYGFAEGNAALVGGMDGQVLHLR